jgi:hypothetical protein
MYSCGVRSPCCSSRVSLEEEDDYITLLAYCHTHLSSILNMAFAIDMKEAPATTEATTDAPPGDDEADNEDDDENGEDTQVTTRTITVEEDEDNG